MKMPSYDKLIPVYGNIGQYRMLRIKRTAQDARVPDTSEAELESQYFDDAFAGVHPDDMERVRKEYKAGYETEHFVVKKYRLLRGDGSYVWVNADLRRRSLLRIINCSTPLIQMSQKNMNSRNSFQKL